MKFDWFELLARWYDRALPFGGPEPLLRLLQLEADHRLLDVGGGTGRVSSTFSDAVRVVVCDPSTGMLAQAQAKGLRVAACQAEVLPFATGSFERLVMVDAFHHIAHQPAAAAEMVRVLAPGGRLVVEEPNLALWVVKAIALGERLLGMQSVMLSLADLARHFQEAGGAVLHQEADGGAIRLVVTRGTTAADRAD